MKTAGVSVAAVAVPTTGTFAADEAGEPCDDPGDRVPRQREVGQVPELSIAVTVATSDAELDDPRVHEQGEPGVLRARVAEDVGGPSTIVWPIMPYHSGTGGLDSIYTVAKSTVRNPLAGLRRRVCAVANIGANPRVAPVDTTVLVAVAESNV